MNRREFLGWIGVGAIASSLPVAIAACTPESNSAGSTSADGSDAGASSDFQAVGTTAQLDQEGQLLVKEGVAAPVLVIRDPNNAEALLAVSPVCTHAGCDVVWEANQTVFVCPCHNSQFGTAGEVLRGPAAQPLPTYDVQVEGDQILVRAT